MLMWLHVVNNTSEYFGNQGIYFMAKVTLSIYGKRWYQVFKEIYFLFVHKMPYIAIAESEFPLIHFKIYILYDPLICSFLYLFI